MPLYEYQCDACAHRFEVIQKYSDPHVEVCPTCGGAVQKLFSSPAIQFKGSGFYITDYARGGTPDPSAPKPAKTDASPSSSDTASASPAESKAKSKADSKAESKAESKPSEATPKKAES